MDTERRFRGGVSSPALWLTWPAAALTATTREVRLRTILGSHTYLRDEVDRVLLKKNMFQWTLRFYGRDGHELSRLRFVPLTSQPVVRDLVALGWPAEEEQPFMDGVR